MSLSTISATNNSTPLRPPSSIETGEICLVCRRALLKGEGKYRVHHDEVICTICARSSNEATNLLANMAKE